MSQKLVSMSLTSKCLKIVYLKILLHLPGANELILSYSYCMDGVKHVKQFNKQWAFFHSTFLNLPKLNITNIKYNNHTTMKFCTYPDSISGIVCAKFHGDLQHEIWISTQLPPALPRGTPIYFSTLTGIQCWQDLKLFSYHYPVLPFISWPLKAYWELE